MISSARLRFVTTVVLFLSVGFFRIPVAAQTATATPTTTPTATPTSTPTSTPTPATPYCASLTSDITTATGAPQTVTFTCAGVDPGGIILAAEFVFGDGKSQTVEKNVGSPGSISVSHIYSTIGTLGASCRVRDNDGLYSPASEACKRIVTIRPATSKAPTAGAAIGTITPTATPTIIQTPTPTIAIQPTLYPQDEALVASDTGSNRFWWIIGGAIALIVGFLLLRRKKPPMPPHAPPNQPVIPTENPPIPTQEHIPTTVPPAA